MCVRAPRKPIPPPRARHLFGGPLAGSAGVAQPGQRRKVQVLISQEFVGSNPISRINHGAESALLIRRSRPKDNFKNHRFHHRPWDL